MAPRAAGRRPLCVLLLLKPSRAAAVEALCADAGPEGEELVRFVQQGHSQEVDVVLQKASDYMVTVGGGCEYQKEFLTEIRMAERRGALVVEPLGHVSIVMHRYKTLAALRSAIDCGPPSRGGSWHPVGVPVSAVAAAGSCGSQLRAIIAEANLRFPVIVKSDYAAGVAGSHRMSVLFSMGHVDEVEHEHPLLVQEYIDHDGLLFKAYFIGEHMHVTVLPSLPNICHCVRSDSSGELGELHAQFPKPIHFDSNRDPVASVVSQFPSHFSQRTQSDDQARCTLSATERRTLWQLGRRVQKQLGLELIGIDFIRASAEKASVAGHISAGEFYVIDVNYLPSYSGWQAAGRHLSNHLRAMYKAHTRE